MSPFRSLTAKLLAVFVPLIGLTVVSLFAALEDRVSQRTREAGEL